MVCLGSTKAILGLLGPDLGASWSQILLDWAGNKSLSLHLPHTKAIFMMKLSLLALIGSAAAFAPAPSTRTSVAVNAGLDDLKSIAEKSNPVLKVCLKKLCGLKNVVVFASTHLLYNSVLRSSRTFLYHHLGKHQWWNYCILEAFWD